MVKKMCFLDTFFVFFGVRGPFGSRRAPGREKSTKNGMDLVLNFGRFRVLLALCGVVLRVCFQERPFCALWAIWWPGCGKKGGFWGPFRLLLGGGSNGGPSGCPFWLKNAFLGV